MDDWESMEPQLRDAAIKTSRSLQKAYGAGRRDAMREVAKILQELSRELGLPDSKQRDLGLAVVRNGEASAGIGTVLSRLESWASVAEELYALSEQSDG